jgi:iron(III) transport system substrate-binding protein
MDYRSGAGCAPLRMVVLPSQNCMRTDHLQASFPCLNSPKSPLDRFESGRSNWRRFPVLLASLLLISMSWQPLIEAAPNPAGKPGRVVMYTSQDPIYVGPILKDFERQAGIKTATVHDSEAVKTVGLANRLLAERSRPQCDVFWNNEELRTRQLAAENVFRETQPWAAMGYRSRRIVINTNLLSLADAPKTLAELTNATWRGKVALAYPLFGTTATHFLALRQHWGAEQWERWCRALVANKPFLVDGNSVVAKLVARGEAPIGLTDSDDITVEVRAGAPLAALPIGSETLLIPNTVGVIRKGPNPETAQKLWEYLQQPAVTRQLIEAGALEGLSRKEVSEPTLQPNWPELLKELPAGTASLKKIFLR